MHGDEYINQLEGNLPFYDLYLNDYIKRLEFCRDNGCNTLMLTGDIEPQQNKRFLVDFGIMMRLMNRPFRNIEIQTTGSLIDEPMLRFLRNHVGVSTIALSLFSFMDDENHICKGNKLVEDINIRKFCVAVKKYDFNLRLCLNLTQYFAMRDVDFFFEICRKELGADQVTLRRLYYQPDDNTDQSKWVMENGIDDFRYKELVAYVKKHDQLRQLEYGQTAYSLKGMSVVIDNDCMAKGKTGDFKYLILRPNGKLYGSWDDPASLIF
jgi:hypothetical protein